MGDIEHWLVYSADEKPELPIEPLAAMNAKWAQEWREVGARVEGPYVPADLYRGAVDLIERAVYPITAALNCTDHPWHGSDKARKWLLDAARLRGQ